MSDNNRTYRKGTLVVNWQPDLCEHCGACIEGLPQVFSIDARPWVNIDGAGRAEIENQVQKCPSGALSLGEVSK